MADVVLRLENVEFRHLISAPKFSNPFAKKPGPGIFSINLEINKGEIIGLVGPNGAGKTTLLRVLAGILSIDSGDIYLEGKKITGEEQPSDYHLRKYIGHMPEQVRWSGPNTVRETITQFSEMRKEAISVDKLLKVVGLTSKSEEVLDSLSQGMRQRLSLAMALMGSPKLLVLDEPFNGLDPVAAKSVEIMIKQLTEKGVSIIISSHQVSGMIGLIDRLALIHKGQIVAFESIKQLEQDMNLDNRIEIGGTGQIPDFSSLLAKQSKVIELKLNTDSWNGLIYNPDDQLMRKLIERGHIIHKWNAKQPDIVEMLCCATGLEIEEIGMEISSSSMIPLKRRGEEE